MSVCVSCRLAFFQIIRQILSDPSIPILLSRCQCRRQLTAPSALFLLLLLSPLCLHSLVVRFQLRFIIASFSLSVSIWSVNFSPFSLFVKFSLIPPSPFFSRAASAASSVLPSSASSTSSSTACPNRSPTSGCSSSNTESMSHSCQRK